MITKFPQQKKNKKRADGGLPGHDFTVIEKDINGNVVMEVHSWCDATQEHNTVTLCMYPEEARMFAAMMSRHADEAIELQADTTKQYGT